MPGLGFLKKKKNKESQDNSAAAKSTSPVTTSSQQQKQPSLSSSAGAAASGGAPAAAPAQPVAASSSGAPPSGSSPPAQQQPQQQQAQQLPQGQSNPHAQSQSQLHQQPPATTQATSAATGTTPDPAASPLHDPQTSNTPVGTSNLANAPQHDGAAHANSNNDQNNLASASATSLGPPVAPATSVSPGTDPVSLEQQQQAARPPPPTQGAMDPDAMQTDQPDQLQQQVQQAQQAQQVHHGQPQQPAPAVQPPQAAHMGVSGHQHAGSLSTTARVTKGKYTLTDFDILRTLGTGSFGRVHLVQSKHNQRFYAIKVLKKAQVVKMKQVEHTNDERRMLSDVKHPFLITLWGTFQDWKNLYMVMDFVEGGELFSLLRKSGRFPNPVAKFYAAEVTLALEYMHSKNIIYRDLKPENLLLDRHGHLKITDFGFAKRVPDKTWTLCGTPDYLAPEVVSNKGYNKSVDWWSLGILIYEMLCGYTPFWDSGSPMRIYENILKGKVKYPAYIVPEAQDLLQKLITADLTKRLGNLYGGSTDVKNHPWFSEVTWDRLARKDIDAPYTPPVRAGAGDASQFDKYPEEQDKYGVPGGSDDFGHLFTEF